MQVLYDEGVATHIGPESCGAYQRVGVPRVSPMAEARREALTGERAGQPLSRERFQRGADDVQSSEGNTAGRGIASVQPAPRGRRPWHARKLLVYGNREVFGSAANGLTSGPHRGGRQRP